MGETFNLEDTALQKITFAKNNLTQANHRLYGFYQLLQRASSDDINKDKRDYEFISEVLKEVYDLSAEAEEELDLLLSELDMDNAYTHSNK